MAGEVLTINIFDINKHRDNLKDLCFKNHNKTIYSTLYASLKEPTHK